MSSYLAGGTKTVDENGIITLSTEKVLINTLFFVLGISFTFFLLGFGFSAMGRFFTNNRVWFARISGIIMIMFGLYQLGVFGRSETIERAPPALPAGSVFHESAGGAAAWLHLQLRLDTLRRSYAGKRNTVDGLLFLPLRQRDSCWLAYTHWASSFPFLAVGIFTGSVLDFFKKKRNVVKYTVKVGAALLILMGVMTLTRIYERHHQLPFQSAAWRAPEQSQITETERMC